MRNGFLITLAAASLLATSAHSDPLTYISGGNQVASPGQTLPAALVVRNTSGAPGNLAWIILTNQTGGATLSNGQISRIVPIAAGETVAESLTFGSNTGVVGWGACLGSYSIPGSTASSFSCNAEPVHHIAAVLVSARSGAPGAPIVQPGIYYVGGSVQSGLPGSTLPNPLQLSNNSGRDQSIFWLILNDTTGGAHFVGGGIERVVQAPTGTVSSISVTLGPNPGLVSIYACRAPAGLNVVDPPICGSGDSVAMPREVIFGVSAVGAGPALAIAGAQRTGSALTLSVGASGNRYEWDTNGDGVIDQVTSTNSLPLTYPEAFSGEISVTTVTSAPAASGGKAIETSVTTKQPITMLAPRLAVAAAGTPVEVCGNGDGIAQPGERFRVPVTITNAGNFTTIDGYANFIAKDRYDAAVAGEGIAGKMAVETPQISVGTLAPGSAMSGSVTVTLGRDAVCGSNYGLLFTGGVDLSGSGPGQVPALATLAIPAGAQCRVYTGSCSAAPKAIIAPREGMFLNPNRGGNGLSNHILPVAGAAPIYFGLWFTGAADRSPSWYAIQAPLSGNVAVSPIYRFRRVIGAPTFQVERSTVGTAVVAMMGTERMLFSWQIGDRSGTELMNYYVGGATPSPNRTGAWFNPAESGSGQVIHDYVVGGVRQTFAIQFIYDAAGEPRWSLGQGASTELAAGASQLTFRVHCPGCAWLANWNSLPINVGTASVIVDDAHNGRFSSSIVLPAPFSGTWTRSNLPIQLLSQPQN